MTALKHVEEIAPVGPPAETILPSQRTPETADHTPQNPDEEPRRRE